MSGNVMAIVLNKPSLRLLGGIGFVATLLIYQGQSTGFLQQLVIPMVAAGCAWLACQNLSAVAFGTGILAILASNVASLDIYPKTIYPMIGLLCVGYLLVIWSLSFHQRIVDTREARWRNRGNPADPEDDDCKTGETGSRSVNLVPLKTQKDTKGNNEF